MAGGVSLKGIPEAANLPLTTAVAGPAIIGAGTLRLAGRRLAHSVPAAEAAVHGTGDAGLRHGTDPVSAALEAIHRTGRRCLVESARTISTVPAVHRATVRAFSAFTHSVAAGSGTVLRATGNGLEQSAYAIVAHRAVRRTVDRVLSRSADAVSAGRFAVHRTYLWTLEHLTDAVSTGGRAVRRAQSEGLVHAANSVRATAAIQEARLCTLSPFTLAVAAHGQAVLGALPAANPHFMQSADSVPAGTAVHGAEVDRARISALEGGTDAITADGLTQRTDPIPRALSVLARIVQCTGILVVTGRLVLDRRELACPLNAQSHSARVAIIAILVFHTLGLHFGGVGGVRQFRQVKGVRQILDVGEVQVYGVSSIRLPICTRVHSVWSRVWGTGFMCVQVQDRVIRMHLCCLKISILISPG